MKVFVLVKNFLCVQDDVEVFTTEAGAMEAFKEYTEFEWNEGYRDPDDDRFVEDFSETVIFKNVEVRGGPV